MAILEILAEARELGVSEVARRLGLSKGSVHRLLTTLATCGYVEKNPGNDRYRLTYRMFLVGGRAAERYRLPELAAPVMEQLALETGENVNLGVLEGRRVINLHRVPGRHPVRLHLDISGGAPAHATGLGKVLLASLPPEALRRLLGRAPLERLTPRTIRTRTALRRELEVVAARGYAVDDEECSLGLRCVAAPIRDARGTVVAAISVAAPAFRLPRERLVSLAAKVMAAAREISGGLGWSPRAAAHHPPGARAAHGLDTARVRRIQR